MGAVLPSMLELKELVMRPATSAALMFSLDAMDAALAHGGAVPVQCSDGSIVSGGERTDWQLQTWLSAHAAVRQQPHAGRRAGPLHHPYGVATLLRAPVPPPATLAKLRRRTHIVAVNRLHASVTTRSCAASWCICSRSTRG